MSQLPGIFKVRASYKPTAEIDTFVGQQGELFYSEGDTRLRISDGVSPGGIVISNNSLGNIEGLTSDGSSLILTLDEGYDLIPETDSEQSLGSPDKKWKDIYVSAGTIFIGENTTIGENPETGSIEFPAGAVMKNSDGTRSPVATVDIDSIDWNTVLAGLDLGLDYATTSYVDGKIRQAEFDSRQAANPDAPIEAAPIELTEITNVNARNPLSGSLLQYNGEVNEWQATNNIETTFGTLRLNGGAF